MTNKIKYLKRLHKKNTIKRAKERRELMKATGFISPEQYRRNLASCGNGLIEV